MKLSRRIRTAARGISPRSPEFASGNPHQPVTKKRDPVRALDVLRPPELASPDESPSPAYQEFLRERELKQKSPDLRERVAGTSWYHTIELPGGVVTPGFYDHRNLVGEYRLPDRLDGKRVLDVATFDGYWAFEFERRGADVTALDLANSMEIDIPPAAKKLAERQGLGVPVGAGFAIAADALGSKVKRVEGSVYRIEEKSWAPFDLVHVGDLLLHLERPLDALRQVRSVTGGYLHISEPYDPGLPADGVRYLGGWADAIWWVPSLGTLCQWIIDAGFSRVEVLRTYRLDSTERDTAGFWRAILRAEP